MIVSPAPKLESAGSRIKSRLTVRSAHALLVLVVLGVPRVVLIAAPRLQLFEIAFVTGAAFGVLVGEIPRGKLLVVFPRPVLGLEQTAEFENDLLVGFRLVVTRAFGDRAGGRPPSTDGVALAAHGDGQHDICMGNRRRRHERIGHHAIRNLVYSLVHTRCVHARARKRIGALQPDDLRHEGLARFNRVQKRVGGGAGHDVRRFNARRQGEFSGVVFARDLEIAQAVALFNIECAFDEQVAARIVDIARHTHEVACCGGNAESRELLLERKTPLDGRVLGRCVQSRRAADVVGIEAADLGRPIGVLALHGFDKLLVAVAPQIDELMVDQILVDDGVEHSDAEGAIGAGPHLQPILGFRTEPSEARIDGDDLRAHLHALEDPMAQEPVGVRLKRLVAPNHDNLRALERRIGVALFVRFGYVDDGHLAHFGGSADHAREVAGETGKAEIADVRRLERRRSEKRQLPSYVAAGAVHEQDGMGSEIAFDGIDLFDDFLVGLVP